MRNHLHITLVGGQPTPVYQGISYYKPDPVIFISSEQTKEEAERIVGIFKNDYQINYQINYQIELLSPVDIFEIENFLQQIRPILSNYSKITVNLTGGTKVWSIIFFDFFNSLSNTEIVYIDQNNKVWDLKTKQFFEHDFISDTLTYLNIFGNEVKKFKKIEHFNKADIEAIKKIEEIRKFDHDDFNDLINSFKKQTNLNEYSTKKGSIIKYNSKKKSFYLKIINKSGKSKECKLNSPNIRYLLLYSGWFEVKVAQILSKWKHTKEIILNCEFLTKEGSVKNEVDIIVSTGKKLFFVECKTQIFNSTDIDKFASVIRTYGGLSTKGVLITDVPISSNNKEKCHNYGIMIFNLKSQNNQNK